MMTLLRKDFICWGIILIGILEAVQGTVSNTKYITRYNKLCTSPCNSKYGKSYWCYTEGASDSWEYCSRSPNEDIEGKKCNNPCAGHGEKYNWCYLLNGGWNYCGLVQNRLQRFKTRYGDDCIDDCSYYPSKGYYYCHTNSDYDYCSPNSDTTIYGKACKGNSKCASHGNSYTWCYTNDGSWDYCGVVQWNSCQNTRGKRQTEQLCMRDTANRIHVVYLMEPGQIATDQLSTALRHSAHHSIARMEISRIPTRPRSNILNDINSDFRIDLQGIHSWENQNYYNLQLQRNIPRRPGQSTTYATVLVPVARAGSQYMNSQLLRIAFIKSLSEKQNIRIIVRSTRSNQRISRGLAGKDEGPEKFFIQDEQIKENVSEGNLAGFEWKLE
ncbi:uncharacterized protein LOC114537874 [Dendronephthya gigantea]|uniref:uncharacterized protein LOC114537874 n=1 Tax=Dendronephthya gigantea TaxID=151771 RepID=UPI0010690D4C|nr:uncharacterized protein LOC114537874 [Dendronephthya gigantea]